MINRVLWEDNIGRQWEKVTDIFRDFDNILVYQTLHWT